MSFQDNPIEVGVAQELHTLTCLFFLGEALPYNMQTAINNGLVSSSISSRPEPPFSCPSGNCTWDPFGTLAISVGCVDTSSAFRIKCSNFKEGDGLFEYVKTYFEGVDEALRPQNCTVSKVPESENEDPSSRLKLRPSIWDNWTQPVFWLQSYTSWVQGPSPVENFTKV